MRKGGEHIRNLEAPLDLVHPALFLLLSAHSRASAAATERGEVPVAAPVDVAPMTY